MLAPRHGTVVSIEARSLMFTLFFFFFWLFIIIFSYCPDPSVMPYAVVIGAVILLSFVKVGAFHFADRDNVTITTNNHMMYISPC